MARRTSRRKVFEAHFATQGLRREATSRRKVFDDIVGKAPIAEVQDKLAFAMHIVKTIETTVETYWVVKSIATAVSALAEIATRY